MGCIRHPFSHIPGRKILRIDILSDQQSMDGELNGTTESEALKVRTFEELEKRRRGTTEQADVQLEVEAEDAVIPRRVRPSLLHSFSVPKFCAPKMGSGREKHCAHKRPSQIEEHLLSLPTTCSSMARTTSQTQCRS